MRDQSAVSDLHFAEGPSVSGSLPGPNAKRRLERQGTVEASTVAYPKTLPFAPAEGATVRDGSVLRLMPPLVVAERQLDVGLDIVDDAIVSAAS